MTTTRTRQFSGAARTLALMERRGKKLLRNGFLLVLVSLLGGITQEAWATITGSGTSGDPYVISSVSDWNTAAQNSTYYTGGVYVALGADLNLGGNASKIHYNLYNPCNP